MPQATKRQKPACDGKIDTGADEKDNQGQSPGYIDRGGPETIKDFQTDILWLMLNRLTGSIVALPDNISGMRLKAKGKVSSKPDFLQPDYAGTVNVCIRNWMPHREGNRGPFPLTFI